MHKYFLLLSLIVFSLLSHAQQPSVWTNDEAKKWYAEQPWLVGCNFIPSTAINELEMWQASTFDIKTIDKELGWANRIGMNVVRVFLHYLPWKEGANGFKKRIGKYLQVADKHHIKTIFVFFDDCWNPHPKVGTQPKPRPGVHNSGWVQCPGQAMHADSAAWGQLEKYEKDILETYKNDNRILLWDLYNEPGNSNYNDTSLLLLKKVFEWAWEIRPSQPLTCGLWYDDRKLNEFQLASSDIISFHNYNKADDLEKEIQELAKHDRPLICTEYMARKNGSLFMTHLPVFKKYQVGAINWGLVSGKTNTIFPWGSKEGSPEPKIWFHDIFRKDGKPFDPGETAFIKKIISEK
jgi:hypothetical protein